MKKIEKYFDLHMEEPIHRIRNWLTSYQPLVLYSAEAAAKAAKAGSKQLTAIFTRLPRRHRRKRKQRIKLKEANAKKLVDRPITQFFAPLVWETPTAYDRAFDIDRNIYSNHPGQTHRKGEHQAQLMLSR